MADVEYCLDLRELIRVGDSPQAQTQFVDGLLDTEAFRGTHRVYVGSSFCPQSLVNSAELIGVVVGICRQWDMRVTLSIPIIAQRFLDSVLPWLDAVMQSCAGTIDELVANDLGMLDYLSRKVLDAEEGSPYQDVAVVVGRLLNKDTRDPRDPEYPWIPKAPNLLQPNSEWGTFLQLMLNTCSRWDEDAQTYRCPVKGIELDPTHETLVLDALPAGITPAINGPLCYMSTGQICEYASIGLADEQALRPNSACANQCTKTCISYRGASDVIFTKLGRTVYFEPAWDATPVGIDAYRQLVSPLKEVRG